MSRVPGWVERWLEWRLGPERASDVLGDLEELAGERSPAAPTLWIAVQVLRLTVRGLKPGIFRDEQPSIRWAGAPVEDVRTALRTMRHTPGASAAILVTLGLAIGATTALFTVADAVMFKTLPFEDPDELVVVWETEPPDMRRTPTSPPNLVDFRDGTTSFAAFGGWAPERFTLTSEAPPIQVLGIRVTEGLFSTLRVAPDHGRLFDAADDRDRRTVVLAHDFWATRYGADRGILGRTITLDDELFEVVGVMAPDFRFPDDDRVAVWVPLAPYPWERIRWTRTTNVIARLAEGASIESAGAQLETVARSLSELHPETNGGWGVDLTSARALLGEQPTLPILLLTVGLVLLIACANVANLLSVRSTEREQEFAIRAALGADRRSVVRLLLIESLAFAVFGAVLGLGVAAFGVHVLMALEPGSLPRWNPVGIDLRALSFTGFAAISVALLAGVAPAARAGRAATARSSWSRATGDRRSSRGRAVLSSLEIALAVVLTSGAALLVASLLELRAEDPGFEPAGLLTATIELPETRYDYGSGRIEDAYSEILERVRALPGVRRAGWVTALPMSEVGTDYDIEFFRVDRPEMTPVEGPPRADFRVVSEGYLEALGVPIVSGRSFQAEDGDSTRAGVLINQTLAQRYFPNENPLGQEIRIYAPDGEAYRVVGVVGDVRHRALDDIPRPELYIHFRLMAHNGMTLAMRTAGDPTDWSAALAQAVREVDPALPLLEVRPMSSLLDRTLAARRFNTALLMGFAALGLTIALVGVQGTLAYAVSRRTREIGVRMALGARRTSVVGQVLGSGMRVIAVGVIVGAFGSVVLGRTMRSLLYGVSPHDVAMLALVTAAVAATATLACLLPALRASRVDPVEALREG